MQCFPDSECILSVVALWQLVHAAVLQVIGNTQRSIKQPLCCPGQQNRKCLQTRADSLHEQGMTRDCVAPERNYVLVI